MSVFLLYNLKKIMFLFRCLGFWLSPSLSRDTHHTLDIPKHCGVALCMLTLNKHENEINIDDVQ